MRRKTAIAVAALLAGVVGLVLAGLAQRGSPPRAAASQSYGERLLGRGEAAAAADALRAEYRARPTLRLKRKLVEALLASNDPAGALAVLRREGGARFPAAEASILRAESLLRLEQPDEAAAEADLVAAAAPAAAALIRARAAYASGDVVAAEARLAEALRSSGAPAPGAWLLRARYALARNDFDVATAAATRAEEAGAPKSAVAALRVESAIRTGAFDRAHRLLGPEKATPGGGADAPYLRVLLDAAKGDYDRASARLRQIEPALSREPRGRLVAAYVREGAGDLAQAEQHFRRAAATAPGDAIAQAALAAFLARNGRDKELGDAVDRLADVAPQAARAYRADGLARTGAFDAAAGVLFTGPSSVLSPRAATFGPHAAVSAAERAADARLHYYAASASALLTADTSTPPIADLSRPPAAADPLALALAGEAALAADGAPGAQRMFVAARRLAPGFSRAAAGLARATLREQGLLAARAVVLGAHAERPDDFSLRLLAARVRQGEGRAQQGAALLAPMIEQVMQSADAQKLYAALLFDADDLTALTEFSAALRLTGAASESALRVHMRAGRSAEAAAAARRLLLASAQPPAVTALSLEALGAHDDPKGEARDEARNKARDEASALVAALSRRRPDDTSLKAAADRLAAGQSLAAAAAAAKSAAGTDDPIRLRTDYLLAPESPETADLFARMLLASGETRRGGMILAESCLWGARAACPATSDFDR